MSTQPTVPSPLHPKKLSAMEAISPALETTKHLMFKPFQWGRWWRMGMIALAAGEMARSGSCSMNFPANFPKNFPNIPNNKPPVTQGFAGPSVPDILHNIQPQQWILFGVVMAVCIVTLVLVHLYVNSVSRFMLFDAVATGRFKLLEGWNRWYKHGRSYFWFQLLMMFLSFLAVAVIFGGMLVVGAASLGGMKNPGPEAAFAFVGVILLGFLLFLPFAFVLYLVVLLAKDFAVPIMAMEGLRVSEAMGKAWRLVLKEKGEFAIYVITKWVLSVAELIVMSIVQIPILLVVMLPLGAGVVVAAIKNPEMFKDPVFLASCITGVLCMVLFLLVVLAIVGAPITVFFQALTQQFFRCRYQPLQDLLYPPPPEAPAPSVADMPLDMTPGNAPAM